MVSKENLGEKPGLIAGGSLLVDYILTVAVSISAELTRLHRHFRLCTRIICSLLFCL